MFDENAYIQKDRLLLKGLLETGGGTDRADMLSHTLLDTFGSLQNVLSADYEVLCAVDGMNDNCALYLKKAAAVVRRCICEEDSEKGISYQKEKDLLLYLHHLFFGCSHERFYLLLFSGSNHLISTEQIGEGGLTSVVADLRKCMKAIVLKGPAFVVAVHNHRQPIARPSAEDIAATRKMQRMFAQMHILFSEHYIITPNGQYAILQHLSASEKGKGAL